MSRCCLVCKYLLRQAKLVTSVKKGNQTAIPLPESLPRFAFLLTKDSALATNQLDTEDCNFKFKSGQALLWKKCCCVLLA